MQYGGYVKKTGKETRPGELAEMAREMAMTVMRVEREKPGCIVEKVEFIIKEDTIAWKVAILEPGEEEERKRRIRFAKGGPLSEAEKKNILEAFQAERERPKIDLGNIVALSEEDAEKLRELANR